MTEDVGDYDYGSGLDDQHFTSWADGRVAINNASQQDAFTDQEGGGGGGNIVLQGKAQTGSQGRHFVNLRWTRLTSGQIDVLRDGVVNQTTADDGLAKDKLGAQTGTFDLPGL